MTAYSLKEFHFDNGGNGATILPDYEHKYDARHIVNVGIGSLFAYGGAKQVGDAVLLDAVVYNSTFDDLTSDEVLNMINDCLQYHYKSLGPATFAPTRLR
jgi:hypothetical protein